jgi:hypothetical protein
MDDRIGAMGRRRDPVTDGGDGEITDEMVAAGVLALSEYDTRVELPEGAVCRVWRAMNAARKPVLPNPPSLETAEACPPAR